MNYELHNKYDVFTKVKKVIESCNTNDQLNIESSMLEHFKLYYDEDDHYLLNTLKDVRYKKLSELVENAIVKTIKDEDN